jgi:hypothetical protein
MSDWQKFKTKLAQHPGKLPATIISILFLAIGFSKDLSTGILTGTIGIMFWIPVLITSWTDRNKD